VRNTSSKDRKTQSTRELKIKSISKLKDMIIEERYSDEINVSAQDGSTIYIEIEIDRGNPI
jgi:hypothetical protein